MYGYVKIPIVMLCLSAIAQADVPRQINHQGVISVNGQRFNSPPDGLFRFAIVAPDSGVNLWSNDGSITDAVAGMPTAAVSLTVTNGVYSVGLGDTSLANMTDEISSAVFNDDNVVLRIWFDDGVNGNQQLTPDHKLTTAPYSFQLPSITVDDNGNVGIGTTTPQAKLDVDGEIKGFGIVPIGSIVAWHKNLTAMALTLPDGWIECTNPTGLLTIDDPESPLLNSFIPDLNSVPLANVVEGVGSPGDTTEGKGGRFLRGSTTSGELQTASVLNHRVDGSGLLGLSFMANIDGRVADAFLPTTQRHGSGTGPVSASEGFKTRPENMTVVWIMRVK